MDVKFEQLEQHLQKDLKPVYLISSDEILLLQEACDLIIHHAQRAGHNEKQRLVAEKGFKWYELQDANSSMSLFGDKKIIDLRIPDGKPGKDGGEAIVDYLEHLSPDNILLIRCPQLNKQSQNSKWVKAIKASGVCCIIWKVKAGELPRWILKRASSRQLGLDHEAANILAQRVEGNLLAAHQEIEKLSLLFPANSELNARHIIQTVANNSRYDVFSMVEQALLGNSNKSIKMLRGLREERTDYTIIAWAMRNELNSLLEILEYSEAHNLGEAFRHLRIWQSKQDMYRKALSRLKRGDLYQFIVSLARLDKAIKGQSPDAAGILAERLLLEIAGVRIPA